MELDKTVSWDKIEAALLRDYQATVSGVFVDASCKVKVNV
jgi:hypothetical protein